MAATAVAYGARSPSRAAAADLASSAASSPLSEVEDGDANDQDIEHMQLDAHGRAGENSSVSGDETRLANKAASDSDSALSDAASDINSDVEDTEAETERLYDTPKNQRQRDVIVDRFNNGQVFEQTPSKLRRTTRAAHRDEVSVSGDDASIASSVPLRKHSPAKSTVSNTAGVIDEVKAGSQERKRKRSPESRFLVPDQPVSKRNDLQEIPEATEHDKLQRAVETKSEKLDGGHHSAGEDDISSTSNRGTETAERKTRKSKRKVSKRKGTATDDAAAGDSDVRGEPEPIETVPEDEAEQAEEELDGDVDEEADLAARNAEEMEKKQAAFRDWTHIEESFSVFRDRLYKDRLQRLEEEEQSLLADEPTHAEYLSMKECINERRNKRLQEADAEYLLQMRAHERRAVAERAQIWSQFYQAIREKREQALEKLNQQWYEVQSARRSAHSMPDYGLLFPKDPAQRIRNAVAYNTEVSALAGLAKFEGFPAGPELKGASMHEMEADLAAIELARHGQQKQVNSHQSREDYHATTFSRLGPAGEQFIKDTPWANPNHSAHKMHKDPGQADAAPGKRVPLPSSAGPAADVRATLDHSQSTAHRSPSLHNRVSGSPDMARSQVPHPMKQVEGMAKLARGPRATAA